ncbi:MAG TPA: hypothetical protein DDX39_00970 [Bacteroidales bacterium]|nr:MAG: hypothetical protein A2W98_06555 [Bacteroidetes bacterium GWF2_33_38]OFY75014.1 MAG: hypothetical protein A2265_11970 [Bacteroidetes bacterium RIFOXYA12_FULL_33_9]OFY88078.1 MAG: hypothetical protein A2236_00350 [Bacteroidetes bacterium RIFOXYA2_FULL_33_7]HBF87183.1 hypothetical protein [Bacteroidales bacterium]
MKKGLIILNVVLLIAVAVLFYFHFSSHSCGKPSEKPNNTLNAENTSEQIAYINTDSLLLKYNYYNFLKDSILGVQKNLENELQKKNSKFEQDVAEFQRKVQLNSFISQESAQQQEQEIYRKQQELMTLKENMTMQLAVLEQNMNLQLYDSVVNFLKIYNADNKYKYILNNTYGGTLLYAAQADNITDTVSSMLNERYKKNQE